MAKITPNAKPASSPRVRTFENMTARPNEVIEAASHSTLSETSEVTAAAASTQIDKTDIVTKVVQRKSTKHHFTDAPPRNLCLPQDGNITGPEILTFLPNCIRSHDVTFHKLSPHGFRQGRRP
jgi:hypothetical protein